MYKLSEEQIERITSLLREGKPFQKITRLPSLKPKKSTNSSTQTRHVIGVDCRILRHPHGVSQN